MVKLFFPPKIKRRSNFLIVESLKSSAMAVKKRILFDFAFVRVNLMLRLMVQRKNYVVVQ